MLSIDLESKIRKLEFNPFNKNEFVAIFRSYLIKVDFITVQYESRYLGEKKMIDFNFHPTQENEFLIAGDVKNIDSHYFAGYLNLYRLN